MPKKKEEVAEAPAKTSSHAFADRENWVILVSAVIVLVCIELVLT